MSDLQLTSEQTAAVSLRGGTLLCPAAAGAGKTRVLVERLFGYILDPNDPANADDFLLITFTRAAAAEMRDRIMKRLTDLCRKHPRNEHLRGQLSRVYTAKICTLDSFCREILTENAAAAGLFSGFRTGDNAELALLEDAALEEALDTMYEESNESSDQPFALLTETFSDLRGDAILRELIYLVWRKSRIHPDPSAFLRERLLSFADAVPQGCNILTEWALAITRDYLRQVQAMLPDLEHDEKACGYLETADGDIKGAKQLEAALLAGWDQTVDTVQNLSLSTLKRVTGQTEMCAVFKELRQRWRDTLGSFKKTFKDTQKRHHDDMIAVSPVLSALCDAAERFDRVLTEQKDRRGILDFADIEHHTYRILTRNPKTAARYAARFREIMVDEYQDINPLQDALIAALSREERNIFYVGDARQSIYRFQMADPRLFLEKLNRYPHFEHAWAGGPRQVPLLQNFRSRPEILAAVNHVFAAIDCPEMGPLPRKSFMQAGGTFPTPLSPPVEILTASAEAAGSRTEREAAAVAERLRRLIDNGEAKPEDCVILMRSLGSRVAVFRDALANVGLDCLAPGGESYFERPEIMTVLSALQTTDNPRNDVALLSVLRSPIVGMSPDELAEMRALYPYRSLYSCLKASELPRAAAFARTLLRWRALSADLPPYELCARILAETALPGQYEGTARNNLLLLPEVLADYNGSDLHGLSAWLSKREAAGAVPLSGVEKGNAVSIMTIHKSKGLQFPVVVVANLAKSFNTKDMRERLLVHPRLGFGPRRRDACSEYPTIAYHALQQVMQSEMRSEELRLLYVAMTRAEHKLILSVGSLPAIRNGRVGQMDFFLSSSVAQWLCEARDPLWPVTEWTPDCPAGTSDAPPLQIVSDEHTVSGNHAASQDQPDSGIPAAVEAQAEADNQAVNAPDVPLPPYAYEKAVLFPSKLTATGLKAFLEEGGFASEEESGFAPEEESRLVPEEESRLVLEEESRLAPEENPPTRPLLKRRTFRLPRLTGEEPPLTAAEKGTSLHMFMQYARYENCQTPDHAAAELTRLWQEGYLTKRQMEAVDIAKIIGFWATEAGQLLLNSPKLHREARFSVLVGHEDIPVVPPGEKVLLQGVIDCYGEAGDGLWLVDFKTDNVRPGKEAEAAERYRAQMDAYTAALQRIHPQKKVISRRIFFFHTLQGVAL